MVLALLSQLSAHVLSLAILAYYPHGSQYLSSVEKVSFALAVSAGTLGVLFGVSILFVTRRIVSREVDVYIAAGLPLGSALGLVLRYYPLRPTAWVAGAAVAAGLVDAVFGLDFLVPAALALVFVALLFGWLSLTTMRTYSRADFKNAGRSG